MNTIAKLLKSPATPAAEIETALATLQARQKAIEQRIGEIQPASGFSSAGPERKRIELEGEPADLLKLDEELKLLQAELRAVPTRWTALHERLQQAQADEAERVLPGQIKALPAALKQYQAARAAAQRARADLDEAMSRVASARRALEAAGRKAPGVPAEQAAAIADALGMEKPDAPGHYSSARAHLFRRLGAPQTEMQEAREHMNARTPGAFEQDDDVDLRRHPEQSIWARKAL